MDNQISKNKVFVIGLDGATFDVIKPLVAQGRLPTFAKIMNEGVHGELESTIPPVSAPAWVSFMTGKNPGKHGIYHFFRPVWDKRSHYRLVNSTDIKSRKLWNLVNDYGMKAIAIDIPITYPPEEIAGFMISGLLTPSEDSIFTHPPSLHTELIHRIGDFPLEDRLLRAYRTRENIEALKELHQWTESRRKATLYLLGRDGWNLFITVFRGTDFVQHHGFRFYDRNYCQTHRYEASKFGDIIAQYYEKMDAIMDEILQQLDQNTTVIIMSDHGAGPLSKYFYVNRWLIQEGLLKLKRPRKIGHHRLTIERHSFDYILRTLGMNFIANRIPHFLQKRRFGLIRRTYVDDSYLVDWKKTKAYMNFNGYEPAIMINLKGRNPYGIVELSEYDELRDYIKQRLLAIIDPNNDKPVIEQVYKREEIYYGPYVSDAPDLPFVPRSMLYRPCGTFSSSDILVRPENLSPATHRMEGILMIAGKHLKYGTKLPRAKIIDLAPTILYLLGLPVPDDMDGKVLLDALDKQYVKLHPIKHEKGAQSEVKHKPLTDEETEKVKEMLKGLGYID